MKKKFTFIDLFAGAGGLSEGFIRAGFEPIAHVEIDRPASNTLKTRAVYHWLNENKKLEIYERYINGDITRKELWESVPHEVISSVINMGIGKENNPKIFKLINALPNAGKVDLIIGGPPCQAYSLAGRSRDKNGMVGDERNYLYTFYNEFLVKYEPKYFVFENVLGMKSAKDEDGSSYFDHMKELFKKSGYETDYKILDTSEYGVPQRRKRIILVGKKGSKFTFPEPRKSKCPVAINEILNDLPSINAGQGDSAPQNYRTFPNEYLKKIKVANDSKFVTWHVARPNNEQDLEIYRLVVDKWSREQQRLNYNELPERLITHKNRKAHLDRFKVVAGNLNYSHTVVAHIAKDGHYYIHPDIDQNRSLTPREAARLQTFPDDFYFEGDSERPSRTAAFKQIGNAVPVLLGEKIARKLKIIW